MSEDKFKFFVPVEIIKGKTEDGIGVMKMKGVASTSSTDADGENLDPNGFELDYFLKHGYMNWNHQTNKNPLAIIGRPTSAKVEGGNMNLECELFEHNPLAKDVYKLGQVLSKAGHSLGFSIEGRATERDKKNPKKVTKAVITGCAITPNPKNRDSVVEIMKGYEAEEGEPTLDLVKSMYSAYENATEEEREKALTASSPSGQAISKESLDGDNKKVVEGDDMKKSEEIEKGEKADPIGTVRNGRKKIAEGKWIPLSEARNVGKGKSGQKAVEKKIKDAKKGISLREKMIKQHQEGISPNKDIINKFKGEIKELKKKLAMAQKEASHVNLSKGEVIDMLIQDLPNSSEDIISKAFDLIQNIENMSKENTTEEISMESIEKAYETLGIPFTKGEATQEEVANEETDTTEEVEDLEKGEKPSGKSDDKKDDEDFMMKGGKKYMMKAGGKYEHEGKMYKMVNGEMEADDDEEEKEEKGLKKSEETLSIETEVTPDLIKSITNIIEEGNSSIKEEVNAKMKAIGTLQKGLENQFAELRERLEDIENQPLPSKTITTKNYLKKGEDIEEEREVKTLSASLHKGHILNILDEECGLSKGEITNKDLANDVCIFESSSEVSELIKSTLAEKGIVLTA